VNERIALRESAEVVMGSVDRGVWVLSQILQILGGSRWAYKVSGFEVDKEQRVWAEDEIDIRVLPWKL